MKRLSKLIMVVFLLLAFVGCSGQQEDNRVKKSDLTIGSRSYISSIAQSYLLKAILAHEGYEANIEILEEKDLWSKLVENKVNVVNSVWFYDVDYYDYKLMQNNVTDVGSNSGYYHKGLVIPSYINIADISELNLYENNFRGIIYCLSEEDYLKDMTLSVLEKYKLSYTIKEVSIEQLEEILLQAYENEEWVVFAIYSPHYIFDKYTLRFLEDYNREFGMRQEIHTLVNTDFIIYNDELLPILENFYLYEYELNSLLSSFNAQGQRDYEEAINQWLEKHPEVIKRCTINEKE